MASSAFEWKHMIFYPDHDQWEGNVGLSGHGTYFSTIVVFQRNIEFHSV